MGILQRSRKRLRVKLRVMNERSGSLSTVVGDEKLTSREIGRASCRERV